MLCLPRNGGSQTPAPATKSANGGSQSAVPARKSAHGGSQSTAPATKSAHGGSQSAAPATTSAHGGSQSAAPATKSAHGGSQSAVPATKSALQETSENSNPNGGTIPTMPEHDPRPSRNRRSADLDLPASEPPVPLKNTAFRAFAISPPRSLYCACHEICTWKCTKCCACHDICTWRFTKSCACHEICTWRFTKCCACQEICTWRSQSTAPATKYAQGRANWMISSV